MFSIPVENYKAAFCVISCFGTETHVRMAHSVVWLYYPRNLIPEVPYPLCEVSRCCAKLSHVFQT